MSVRPIREPDWLFVPPLELPLASRLENGRFGAPRPRGPALQIHEAVDLAAHAGDPVYAWEVRTQPDAEPAGGPLTPQSIATLHLHGVPFFAATFRGTPRPCSTSRSTSP